MFRFKIYSASDFGVLIQKHLFVKLLVWELNQVNKLATGKFFFIELIYPLRFLNEIFTLS